MQMLMWTPTGTGTLRRDGKRVNHTDDLPGGGQAELQVVESPFVYDNDHTGGKHVLW